MTEKQLGIVVAGVIAAFLTWIVGTAANSDAVVKVAFGLWILAIAVWIVSAVLGLFGSSHRA